MSHPLFSIIVPVYNSEAYIEECLDSLLQQSYDDYEIICINDGSTDKSVSILDNHKRNSTRINVFNQSNSGLSAARNAGMTKAQGKWILFVDSDDIIYKHSLRSIANTIESHPNVELIEFCATKTKDYLGSTTSKSIHIWGNGWSYWNDSVSSKNEVSQASACIRAYRKDLLERNSLQFLPGIYHEDNLFTPICCYFAKTVVSIPDCLYLYRVHSGSIMTNGTLAKHSNDMACVANELYSFFENRPSESKQIYKHISSLYRRSICYSDKTNDSTLTDTINTNSFKKASFLAGWKARIAFLLFLISPSVFRSVTSHLS